MTHHTCSTNVPGCPTRTKHHGLALALLLLASACTPIEEPERIASAMQPIVGGRIATNGDILGTVLLLERPSGLPGCTGTLVAPNVVVTAAHCVVDYYGDMSAYPAETIAVAAGVLDWNEVQPDNVYNVLRNDVRSEFPNNAGEYDDAGLGAWGDIAVLVLDRAVEHVSPVPILPLEKVATELTPGQRVTITGYGMTSLDYDNQEVVLYTGDTPIVRLSDNEILAGGAGEPDACFGDSGGPMYLKTDASNYLVGATSRGRADVASDCGEGGIYTLVPAYKEWIDDIIGDNPAPPIDDDEGEGNAQEPTAPANPAPPAAPDASSPPKPDAEVGGCSAAAGAHGPFSWAVLLLVLGAIRRSR